ncbi:FtsX-like permease family protein [Cellulomonas sp. SG140]|uniref:FtsX-like permease family protein n=1 Tax=Cellulomonas sp. SG140 TaxID=2976536 RepID=UPI0021E6FB5F|nr:FtsX-like permease family protein [Cellulomonas sp. SG140]
MTSGEQSRGRRVWRAWTGGGLAGLGRRAAQDAWPLAVLAVVLLLTVTLADAAPRELGRVADRAVQVSVAAEPSAGMTVSAPFDQHVVEAVPDPGTADQLIEDAAHVRGALPRPLANVLGAPSAEISTTELAQATPSGPAVLRLAYLWRDGFAGVDWVEGRAPGPSAGGDLSAGQPWPVEVGLSAPVAELTGAHPGDRLAVSAPDGQPVVITVSGVFRARDPGDPLWARIRGILQPSVRGAGAGRTVALGALLSAASVPDVRLALDPQAVSRVIEFPVRPEALRFADLGAVARAVSALQAAPTDLGLAGPRPTVWTQLDQVVRRVQARVLAAGAQASVLLVGLLAASVGVLGLGSWLLVRRRAAVLRRQRARGASLGSTALGLTLEQAVLCVLAGSTGLVAGRLLVPGPPSWPRVLPVLVLALAAAPVLGALTVGGRPSRRAEVEGPALRERSRRLRAAAGRTALLLVAVAALVTLRRRGLPVDPTGADLLLVLGPALGAVAAGILGVRVLVALHRVAVPITARLRSAGPMLATAGGAAAGGAAPFVALTLCTALTAFGVVVGATVTTGEAEGSWDSVGADVLVHTDADHPLDALAAQLDGAAGVRAVALGRLEQNVQVFGVAGTEWVDVLAVDSQTYDRLLAATPLPEPQGMAALGEAAGGPTGRPLPVLAAAALRDGGSSPSLLWHGQTVPLRAVGPAPALSSALAGTGPRASLVVVDRAALSAVAGGQVDADVLWAAGPGAEAAVTRSGVDAAAVTGRGAWLDERRHEPLTAGLLLLLRVAVPVLLGLAALVVVLATAADAPRRDQTLAVLRVLGLDTRQVRRVAVGEALPWTLLATACGLATGTALGAFCLGPLDLRLVTGQSGDPALVAQAWVLVLLPVLAGVAGAASAVQVGRGRALGQVMRIGVT